MVSPKRRELESVMRSVPKRFLAFTLCSLFVDGVPLCAQSVSVNDPAVIVTRIEGPKNGAFALGDSAAWFETKDRLFRIDPQSNELSSVGTEELQRGNWWLSTLFLANFAVGGGYVWRFGKAHGVQGIHRVEPDTGKCVA